MMMVVVVEGGGEEELKRGLLVAVSWCLCY